MRASVRATVEKMGKNLEGRVDELKNKTTLLVVQSLESVVELTVDSWEV
jgi:hypothetical protein